MTVLIRTSIRRNRTIMYPYSVLLLLVWACMPHSITVRAEENNNGISNSGNDSIRPTDIDATATAKLDTSQARDNSALVLEHINVNQLSLDDSSFKLLIKHCLKSQNPKACDGMSQWDTR